MFIRIALHSVNDVGIVLSTSHNVKYFTSLIASFINFWFKQRDICFEIFQMIIVAMSRLIVNWRTYNGPILSCVLNEFHMCFTDYFYKYLEINEWFPVFIIVQFISPGLYRKNICIYLIYVKVLNNFQNCIMFINGFSFENYYYRQHLVIFIIIILHNTQCSEQIQCCPIHTFIFQRRKRIFNYRIAIR